MNELETITGFNSWLMISVMFLKLPKLQVLEGSICDEESLSMIVDHILNHQDQFQNVELLIVCDINMDSEDGSTLLRRLVMCESLSILRIMGRLSKLPAYEAQLYRNVTILWLMNTKIEEDPMKILEKLPMLRTLSLGTNAYMGIEMVCGATGFPQLKGLTLDKLPNLVEWRVEEGAMPNLSNLYISRCNKLEMIPEGLKFITTLKQLVIGGMPAEFKKRVNDEEGEDYHKIKHIPFIDFYEYQEFDED
ncbi:Disease resistance RPP8-like protein 3 [Sesamum alatum]|uniref:Disease resistance RPP8-like protein 3 n=1 Tax=Sesamum alatum TaxID=300844 RepID=A0AAE1Y8U1_9LAMI|nr:Disease resistance RPP8-like protein 3 [Sesamum alatum]